MITRSLLARAAASVVLAGALLVSTAGCTFISNQATLIQYDPSDGVGANVGDIHVRNMVGIINEDGSAISLIFTIVNSGAKTAKVNIQFQSNGAPETVVKTLRAGETLNIGDTTKKQSTLIVAEPDVPAGALLPVYVQYGDNEGSQLMVPVLEPTGIYAELGPAAVVE